MARPTIALPEKFRFNTHIPIRITDLNYGGHVGNDSVLSIIHEARVQFLHSFGFSEKNFGGKGIIMGDVSIIFRNEIFYGDRLVAHVDVAEISRASFELIYLLEKQVGSGYVELARARTGMVCYDYEKKKVCAIPEVVTAAWR